MGNKHLARGLEEISDIFLSAGEKAKRTSHPSEDHCEIEEIVTVCKKIVFYNDNDVQKNIGRSLGKHLEQGYQLRQVCLQKNEDISTPGSRTHRKEDVIISIKSSN